MLGHCIVVVATAQGQPFRTNRPAAPFCPLVCTTMGKVGLPGDAGGRRPAFVRTAVVIFYVLGTVTPGTGKAIFNLPNLDATCTKPKHNMTVMHHLRLKQGNVLTTDTIAVPLAVWFQYHHCVLCAYILMLYSIRTVELVCAVSVFPTIMLVRAGERRCRWLPNALDIVMVACLDHVAQCAC